MLKFRFARMDLHIEVWCYQMILDFRMHFIVLVLEWAMTNHVRIMRLFWVIVDCCNLYWRLVISWLCSIKRASWKLNFDARREYVELGSKGLIMLEWLNNKFFFVLIFEYLFIWLIVPSKWLKTKLDHRLDPSNLFSDNVQCLQCNLNGLASRCQIYKTMMLK